MKKLVAILLVLLGIFSISFAFADTPIFAFEDAEYSVFVGKTIKPKTVAQGIEGKLTYTYSSSDESVTTVSKGTVKGISAGVATVTCTATDKKGNTYTATCNVTVNIQIKSIKADVKAITLAPDAVNQFEPVITIDPADASIQELEWSSSKPEIAEVADDGTITGMRAGTATVTGKATDGSGKTVKIQVTVPKCYVTEEEITLDTPEGTTLGYLFARTNGFNSYGLKVTGDVVSVDSIDDENGLDMLKIIPLKAGTGSIAFIHNGRAEKTVKVKVEHSAVYDKVSYPPVAVASLLASQETSIGTKTQVTCEVVKIEEIEEMQPLGGLVYAVVEEKGGRQYVIFEYDEATALEEEKEYTIYGEVASFADYVTDTGLAYVCPYFINGHINY